MSRPSRARLGRVMTWLNTLAGRWAAMLLAFAVVAVLFHPLFLVMGGVIGAVTFGLVALGGYVLGPRQGVFYALLTSVLAIPLWSREYGFALTENISGPIVSALIAYGVGHVRLIVQRMREQAESLKRTNSALQAAQLRLLQAEKLALFGEVAAGVAHELNQPLAIIGLAAQMGQRSLSNGREDVLAEQLERIRVEVRRAGQIIRRLKSTARDEEPDVRRDCSLNDIVRAVGMQFQPQFQALGIALKIQLAPALAPLRCNPTQMEQALACLLLNARDAVNDAAEKRIVVTTSDREGHLGLAVEDTGSGITREVMRRIFDPFFTTKEIGVGSGLGLPVCHRIVSDHGGTIDVSSNEGEGSRFTIILPASSPPGEATSSGLPPAQASASREVGAQV